MSLTPAIDQQLDSPILAETKTPLRSGYTTQPPTNVRYLVLIVSVLMALCLYLDRVCLATIIDDAGFRSETNLSKEQTGLLLSAFYLTYALFQVPTGWLSDKLGGRLMLPSYIALWSIVTGLTGLMTTSGGMLTARYACGAAQAGAYPTSTALVRRWFPLLARGNANAIIALGGRMGGTLAPLLTTLLIAGFGSWRLVLVAYGLFGIVVAAFYWWIVRDRPSDHPRCNRSELEFIGRLDDDQPVSVREIGPMLWACCCSMSMWLNSIGQFSTNVGWAFLVTWLPTYLTDSFQVDPVTGAGMVTGILAAGLPGQLAGGRAADLCVKWFGLRRGRMLPLVFASNVAAIAYIACLFATNVWMLVACCAIVSFMTDFGSPCSSAFVQDVGGRNTASVYGWGNMWGNLGASACAVLVPWLISLGQTSGLGDQLLFTVCAGGFVATGVTALGMNPLRPILPAAK
jgi:MFS family permease